MVSSSEFERSIDILQCIMHMIWFTFLCGGHVRIRIYTCIACACARIDRYDIDYDTERYIDIAEARGYQLLRRTAGRGKVTAGKIN